jgi:F-type H+-transporting ATPase subunit c
MTKRTATTTPIITHRRSPDFPNPFLQPNDNRKTMEPTALAFLGAGLGAGLVALGAGLGIGKLAGPAMEGSARQPEAAGDIRTSMIIAAALIEGVALFGLVICIILATK